MAFIRSKCILKSNLFHFSSKKKSHNDRIAIHKEYNIKIMSEKRANFFVGASIKRMEKRRWYTSLRFGFNFSVILCILHKNEFL